MEIHIDDETDGEIAQAIATAVAEHLGTSVELVDGGETLAEAGTEWDESGTVLTDREARLRDDVEAVLSGGPERGFEKIRSLGKAFVRDRLELVFDDIVYEDGTFARFADDETLPADGLVTGIGTIDGRKVAFTANDYTVKAGSLGQMGVEKVIRIQERAMDLGIPMVRLVDSTGARLNAEEREPGDTHMDRYRGGKMFYNQCRMSGEIPQIGVLYGPNVAGSAYTPVFCDVLVMVEDISGLAIASPRIVEAMTGEETDMSSLGGPQVHARHSGSADIVVPDEETAAERVRELLGLLPQSYAADPPTAAPAPPAADPNGLDQIIPEEPNAAYDVHTVIERLVDRESFLELKPSFAPELVTGFARIDGQPVGIVANQPDHVSGAIFPDSADKGAGFVWTCDAYNIPLVYLCDTPGFMIGSQVEREGVLRKGRKFIYATSNAQVPKFCVITRKAYGAGIYAMAGPSFGPDATLALPSAEISVMGPDAAVHALFGGQLEGMDEESKAAFVESAKEQFEAYIDIRKQASTMQVDELLPAGDLREQLAARLDTYRTKSRDERPRHHGTVLF
ncbi:propionyl-CoA carboxylase carboxyltransferase component [Natronomonas pharaonis DSM 2160]|uniref:Propionyl-CoA carboxylase carboxyltransferase component n=1 Tax=Natronomonas pharaonis (strain ATCC 35678 / DSM 2160 / CIP 103997 / JCM 8858 / NBRC 14720 / NCIMB 2260 / Gabara) TaxID=348780 RepID=A0A1U7EXC5_NATPD|nr:acyl-CoA carboxylase subunit beta [Natronomonas pharaonis]CAI49823.1 propionyl-CoA carboxylase carboxyltransferase component [Natronomonas pharaonis DSM 2160]